MGYKPSLIKQVGDWAADTFTPGNTTNKQRARYGLKPIAGNDLSAESAKIKGDEYNVGLKNKLDEAGDTAPASSEDDVKLRRKSR